MTIYNDLEIGISEGDAKHYNISLRLIQHYSLSTDLGIGPIPVTRSALDGLRSIDINTSFAKYSQCLKEATFSDESLRTFYGNALAITCNSARRLRLRISIPADALTLQSIYWEAMQDPLGDSWLLTNENVLFSRQLGLRTINRGIFNLPYRHDLKGMIAVANPELDRNKFPSLVVEDQINLARDGMKALCPRSLVVLNERGAVTFERLIEAMRGCDVVYLVAHGSLEQPTPGDEPTINDAGEVEAEGTRHIILLQKEDGRGARIPAQRLVKALADMPSAERPRLIVLATCESATTGEAMAALGPLLSLDAAIPAVIAMQGKITVNTLKELIPRFFQILSKQGEIDQALAIARRSLDESFPDRWMPLLFMQLRFGSIWGRGFVDDGNDDIKRNWNDLLLSIHNKNCIPVLGPELLEPLIGSPRDFAHKWASEFELETRLMPFDGAQRYNMTHVAQYLSTYGRNPQGVKMQYLDRVQSEILVRYGDLLKQQGLSDVQQYDLPKLIEAIGFHLSTSEKRSESDHPYHRLSELPFPIVVTANPDSLLADTMRGDMNDQQGKKVPEVGAFLWNRELNRLRADGDERVLSIYDSNEKYRPSVQKPLIYHLLGRLEIPESLVLTEDDHFDYLMHVNLHLLNRGQVLGDYYIPPRVVSAMERSTMLFLGFQLDDWSFRVLLRSIAYLGESGRANSGGPLTVAVQIDPQVESRDPSEVRDYLKNHYRRLGDIRIYWGNTLQFINELCDDYRNRYGSIEHDGLPERS